MGLEHLFTVNEAAAYLRVSRWTVYAWLTDGRLRKTKLGSRCLISESELVRWVKEGSRSPVTAASQKPEQTGA